MNGTTIITTLIFFCVNLGAGERLYAQSASQTPPGSGATRLSQSAKAHAEGPGAGNGKAGSLVYMDKAGVLRYTDTKQEASFFGVNYTVPFAYSYRAHRSLGVDPEQAIRQDVYHLARLGLDAFRVHVWDTEISDSVGNLLENEHLRLFDFLLAELAKRRIRVIITPIAFWGNGYPDKDEHTPGFSRVYGKHRATVDESAIQAQENYLRQLFRHVNPYTHLSYGDDPDIIAVELNNEPDHSGPGTGVTQYIDRLAAAVRGSGWSKPLFYNISQNPYYAGAVAASTVDGFSFQWYPSGLVSGHELKGNYLPNVDRYTIPFDTLPNFAKKARMVYEFDAADILQSCMYPAMARSFREAGFQWATQFAYDPLALAYANTEYQTHYLNLAYTPSKAISLLIAARAFHRLPRGGHYGSYPRDSVFGEFRVSYRQALSEMNSREEFYYSNNTGTKPVDVRSLRHLAGVGSSPVLHYSGSGAYFLDKLADGSWRLELMPDLIQLQDPFAQPSPDRAVGRISWKTREMEISLPDLGEGFAVEGLNEGNHFHSRARGRKFMVSPGTYLLTGKGNRGETPSSDRVPSRNKTSSRYTTHSAGAGSAGDPLFADSTPGVIGLKEFVAPAGEIATTANAEAALSDSKASGSKAADVKPSDDTASEAKPSGVKAANPIPRKYYPGYHDAHTYALEYTTGDQLKDRTVTDRQDPVNLIIRARVALRPAGGPGSERTQGAPPAAAQGRPVDTAGIARVRVTLIDADAAAWFADITLTDSLQDISLPLKQLQKGDSFLLLPRPYPGFLPLWFKANGPAIFRPADILKIQLMTTFPDKRPLTIELQAIQFR